MGIGEVVDSFNMETHMFCASVFSSVFKSLSKDVEAVL